MLFEDNSRRADTQSAMNGATNTPYTPETGNTGVLTEQRPDQLAMPGMQNMPGVPGTAQASLVPAPINADMMPATSVNANVRPLRQPVFVPSSGKKSTSIRPPQGRRFVVSIGAGVLLLAVLAGTLFAILPTGNGQASGLQTFFAPTTKMVSSKNNTTVLIAAQAATATAVTQDGYDAGNQVYSGVTTSSSTIPPSDAGSLNRFFYGQCTYWANMRYHELTGHWIPWLGNADAWAWNAPGYGWQTSSYPNPNGPSIIVLAPYTEGAGSYGHVAVVESGVSAASAANGVSTSNWNWDGNWGIETWVTFYPGSGVTFIWY
jgi:surface antigen